MHTAPFLSFRLQLSRTTIILFLVKWNRHLNCPFRRRKFDDSIVCAFYLYFENATTSLSRLPWNWKNPTAYFGAILLESLWLAVIVPTISCELSLFVRFFILLGAPAKEITANILDFENVDQMTIGERNQMMWQKVVDIVRFQEEAKKFVLYCIISCRSRSSLGNVLN